MKIFKLSTVLFVSLFFLNALFAQTDLIKEQTLETNYGKDLTVSVPGGDVNISTWSKEQVYVKITGNDEAKNAYDFKITSDNEGVSVKTEKKSGEKEKNISLKIEISAPEKYNIKVSTAGGDIKIDNGLTGDVKMNTAGGNIDISSVNGECKINTAGGNINVMSFKGNMNANTAGGDITLKGSDGEVSANTTGGKVELSYSGENKEISLNSMKGDIVISLPSDFKADVSLTSMSGEVKSGISIEKTNSKKVTEMKNHIKGKMNGGGNPLKCATMGGNILIKPL